MVNQPSNASHLCKICNQPIGLKYNISAIDYFLCHNCNFLQNFYWNDTQHTLDEQYSVNNERREQCWPAGEKAHMYEKGWELLELMYWPPAWFSRKLNNLLKIIPGYRQLSKSVVKRRSGRLLDVGCGHGVALLELRRRDNIDIIGLDPFSPTDSPHIIKEFLEKSDLAGESFDGIMAIETLEHINDGSAFLAELHRLLKPSGVLLIQSSRLDDPEYKKKKDQWFYLADPKTHVSIYSKKALQKLSEKIDFAGVRFRGAKFARFIKKG